MRQIIILLTIVFVLGCNQIENKEWKYRDGFYIVDWITFKNAVFFIKNDTIYFNDMPVARIFEYRYRFFEQVLVIEQLNDTIKGYYCSK